MVIVLRFDCRKSTHYKQPRMTMKCHIHRLQTNPRHRDEEQKNTYSIYSLSKADRSFVLSTIIAKLEMTKSIAQSVDPTAPTTHK